MVVDEGVRGCTAPASCSAAFSPAAWTRSWCQPLANRAAIRVSIIEGASPPTRSNTWYRRPSPGTPRSESTPLARNASLITGPGAPCSRSDRGRRTRQPARRARYRAHPDVLARERQEPTAGGSVGSSRCGIARGGSDYGTLVSALCKCSAGTVKQLLAIAAIIAVMDLRQLAALAAVADAGSFSAAARRLHTVQSNVSTHIAARTRAGNDAGRPVQRCPHRGGRGGGRPSAPSRTGVAPVRRGLDAPRRVRPGAPRLHRDRQPLAAARPPAGDGRAPSTRPGGDRRRHDHVARPPGRERRPRPGRREPAAGRRRADHRAVVRRAARPRSAVRASPGEPRARRARRPGRTRAARAGDAVPRRARPRGGASRHPDAGPGGDRRRRPARMAGVPGLRRRHPAGDGGLGLDRDLVPADRRGGLSPRSVGIAMPRRGRPAAPAAQSGPPCELVEGADQEGAHPDRRDRAEPS